MSNFTDNTDNFYLTASGNIEPDGFTDDNQDVNLLQPSSFGSMSRSTSVQAGDPAYPTPEEIAECSPGATFTTYKMGGSTGLTGKENQDACSVVSIKKSGIKYAVTVVCDGHGKYGQQFSNHVVALMSKLVVDNFKAVLSSPVEKLKEIFSMVSDNLKETMGQCAGGTTATLTILSDGMLICANVGDCEALLKIEAPEELVVVESNGVVCYGQMSNQVIRATVDHNCSNFAEVERVLATGAKIKYATSSRTSPELDVFTCTVNESGTIDYKITPHSKQTGGFVSNASLEPAIYFHADTHRLNMTRSLGDWNVWFLSTEPDVTVITWPKSTRARLLVASDGYFNCFNKNQQELEMDFSICPVEMCKRGHIAVGKVFSHAYADNTTIVVLETGNFV